MTWRSLRSSLPSYKKYHIILKYRVELPLCRLFERDLIHYHSIRDSAMQWRLPKWRQNPNILLLNRPQTQWPIKAKLDKSNNVGLFNSWAKFRCIQFRKSTPIYPINFVSLTLICWRLFLWRLCWRGSKTTPRDISVSRLARNRIPTATPMSSGSNVSTVQSVTLPDETGSQNTKMAAEIM